jgi:hypothetical protein
MNNYSGPPSLGPDPEDKARFHLTPHGLAPKPSARRASKRTWRLRLLLAIALLLVTIATSYLVMTR